MGFKQEENDSSLQFSFILQFSLFFLLQFSSKRSILWGAKCERYFNKTGWIWQTLWTLQQIRQSWHGQGLNQQRKCDEQISANENLIRVIGHHHHSKKSSWKHKMHLNYLKYFQYMRNLKYLEHTKFLK